MATVNGPTNTADDLRKDMQSLKDDVARLAGQLSDALAASSEDAFGGVRDRFRRVRDNVGGAVYEAGERSRDAVTEFADTVGSTLEDNVKARPFSTLALALGLGFLFGALWRR
ncbi:hypothetical protein CCR97_02400 [Rhodoplanes elegans]|uniref:DUF883 domain-containing protein n=1 Tax=Rhodoplanes elegans TaxID=29408 RepID=A0A327KJ38_9BRAD|nr:DUF883 family protein [Rhodoplanes elegans]MBK5957067.1 hypothetical protein [Rhodoplanes elegans]RAI37643.1 hypothetical protein CH338_15405 [Rhodoplanes elegans]